MRDREALQDLQAQGDGRLDLPRGHPDRRSGELIESAAIAYSRRRADRAPTAGDRGVPGRPAVLRGDLSRGGQPGPRRGRADLRRPRLARVPPAARREHPASSSITTIGRRAARRQNGKAASADDPPTPAVDEPSRRSIGQSIPHESAHAHVTGQAVYLDDLPPFRNELLVEFVGSPLAHARIVAVDVAEAAQDRGNRGRVHRGRRARRQPLRPDLPRRGAAGRATSAITSASRSSCWPARAARPCARPGRRSGSSWSRCRPSCRSTRRSPAATSSARRGGSRGATPRPRWRGPSM